MSDSLKYTALYSVGREAARTETKQVTKKFLGISWKTTQKVQIPARSFDTRQGDSMPMVIVECSTFYSGTFEAWKVCIYNGAYERNPTFENIRKGALDAPVQKLMACIIMIGHESVDIPLSDIEFRLGDVDQPRADITFEMRTKMLEFPGPWGLRLSLTFKDREQMEAHTVWLADPTELTLIQEAA